MAFTMGFFGVTLHLTSPLEKSGIEKIEIAKGLSYIDIGKGSHQLPLVPPVGNFQNSLPNSRACDTPRKNLKKKKKNIYIYMYTWNPNGPCFD